LLKRKYMVVGLLAFCLAAGLFVGITTSGTTPSITATAPYDPWCDINRDGVINIIDIVSLGIRFDTTGTPIPMEGNISVPAAAFVSCYSTYDTYNGGSSLQNNEVSATAYFVAALKLPHGATVTNVTFYWYDVDTTWDVQLGLTLYNQTYAFSIAWCTSSGDSGYGSSYDDTIYYATINNNEYAYFLRLIIPPCYEDLIFQYAIIEYQYLP